MADKIGVARKWWQSLEKTLAIQYGAIEIT
jgi:hypothetical protein